jgi:hypothetical protein
MSSPHPTSFKEQARSKQRGAWREFGSFLLHNKKWWLAPIVLLLLALGGLVLLGGSGLAPFIYTLF